MENQNIKKGLFWRIVRTVYNTLGKLLELEPKKPQNNQTNGL